MSGFAYLIKNKKGEVKDFWIMDKSDPKKADYIFSVRFSKYVKPKRQHIYKILETEIEEYLHKNRENIKNE